VGNHVLWRGLGLQPRRTSRTSRASPLAHLIGLHSCSWSDVVRVSFFRDLSHLSLVEQVLACNWDWDDSLHAAPRAFFRRGSAKPPQQPQSRVAGMSITTRPGRFRSRTCDAVDVLRGACFPGFSCCGASGTSRSTPPPTAWAAAAAELPGQQPARRRCSLASIARYVRWQPRPLAKAGATAATELPGQQPARRRCFLASFACGRWVSSRAGKRYLG
jgi:hypothetical protein